MGRPPSATARSTSASAMLSTYRDVRGVNALKLLDAFAHASPSAWEIDPSSQLKSPTRFRVPLGGSVGPTMGPTFLVVGDAAGAANPFNGDGVDAALMTRSPRRRSARRGAHHRQLDHPAAIPDDPRRRRRPVPQGRSARARACSDAPPCCVRLFDWACAATARWALSCGSPPNELRDQRPGRRRTRLRDRRNASRNSPPTGDP